MPTDKPVKKVTKAAKQPTTLSIEDQIERLEARIARDQFTLKILKSGASAVDIKKLRRHAAMKAQLEKLEAELGDLL